VAGGIAAIPAGTFLRGSWPGPNGRDPRKEVDLVPTSVAAFEIDRLPYPDDPAREPLVNVTLHEAAARCATDGRRLCTEVEWEYACKGPQNQTYPYGDDYGDGRYADPSAVVSSFGVLQMTVRYEWTAGDWVDAKGATVGNVAPLRGAHPTDGAAAERRCANRTGLDPTRGSPRIGFRCCRGAGFPGAYEMEPTRRAFRPGPLMSDPAFARLVRSIPELARVHDDPRLQGDGVVTQAMLRSSLAEASGMGYSISVQPVLWIPVPGEELLGIVGRCGRDLFAATLYTTGVPGLYAHAASLVLTDVPDDEGIALFGGFRDRKLLGWGECDDCREGGSFEYHEEDGTITPGHRW
jgi:hypothetical protein